MTFFSQLRPSFLKHFLIPCLQKTVFEILKYDWKNRKSLIEKLFGSSQKNMKFWKNLVMQMQKKK
jgi:hypothetical protein